MKALARRHFLYGMFGLAAASAAGCSPLIDNIAQPELPQRLTLQGGNRPNAAAHLLNRTAFGPRPGQIQQVAQIGHAQWIDQQLDYERLKDEPLDLRLRRFETLRMKAVDMHSLGWDKAYIAGELGAVTLVRAIYSQRQLYERMVGFWSDHFNIYAYKDEVIFLKTIDDRDVIRPHALGRFGDLLRASAHSPAMLRYLDNTLNIQGQPNENYAREIMELHTLGVNGGYSEQDVKEVARCFTGWTVNARDEFLFRGDWHDTGEKSVLGHIIPSGGGQADAERVLDILIDHPSTRRFVCSKLVQHFVADDPPAAVVDRCVQTWTETGGDIRSIMRTLLNHPDFANAPPKFKRPFDLVASLLRAANAQYDGNRGLTDALDRLGQRPFAWPRPDGYPDIAVKWQGNLVDRWNFCVDIVSGKIPGVEIDLFDLAKRGNATQDALTMLRFWGRLFLNQDLDAEEEQSLWRFALAPAGQAPDLASEDGRKRMLNVLALLIAGPAFQQR